MKSVGISSSVVAAVAAIFVLNAGIIAPAPAQQTAAANPELAAKGAWDETVTYALDDIVTARGSSWISLRNNNRNRVPGQTQPSTAIYWQLFSRGFNPTGAWSNATKYQADDLVTRGGQTWRAKRTVQASATPPAAGANWELFAAKGADGDDGAQGPAGPNTGIGAGSAAAPSISFSGDPGTGIFHPGAGKIALVENGALFLHNAGNYNTALGLYALSSLTTGAGNTALGQQALNANQAGQDNTAVGNYALLSNTSGERNIAIGKESLQSNTTASNNIAVGNQALVANTSGERNVAVGGSTLYLNTSGADNIAIGDSALHENTTNSGNVAIGTDALRNSTTTNNTAIGQYALKTQTTGYDNTAVGTYALFGNTVGDSNVAVGSNTLTANTSGVGNVAIGGYAVQTNSTGNFNTAIGTSALRQNTTGSDNIALGRVALFTNATGGSNTAVGTEALQLVTSSNNTAVGYQALQNVVAGANNIALGTGAGVSAGANTGGSIYIGNAGSGSDSNTIKIGTQGTQTTAFMAGITGVTVANEAAVAINTSTGQLGVVSSSRRYKEDIAPMGDVNATLMKLRPVTFHYAAAHDDGRRKLQYGLIAEEVAESVPDLAAYNAQGTPETVKYHLLPSFLLAGYQAQQQTIAAQTQKIDAQASEIARLKERVAASEALEARLARLEALSQSRAAALR